MPLRIFVSLLLAAAVLASCSKESNLPVEKQIDALRKERAAIDDKIRTLESSLGSKTTLNSAQVVTTMTTAIGPFVHTIDVKGLVDSRSTVQVSSLIGGRIIRVGIVTGQSVTKGQLLFELDAEVVRKGLSEVKLQLDFARILYEKQKRIYEQKAGSEVQYLTAKNQVEALESRYESLNEQLTTSRIVSPIAGFTDNVGAKVGEMAMPGMPLTTIVNNSDMRIVVDLAETYISSVSSGDPVKVMFGDINDSLVTRISTVSRTVNPLSRTFRIEIPVRTVPANLRPNATCRVVITDQTIANTLTVPLTGLLRDNAGPYVFTLDAKSIAHRKNVVTGLTSGGNIEITSGLAAGEQIVVRGATDIADGQLVRTVTK